MGKAAYVSQCHRWGWVKFYLMEAACRGRRTTWCAAPMALLLRRRGDCVARLLTRGKVDVDEEHAAWGEGSGAAARRSIRRSA